MMQVWNSIAAWNDRRRAIGDRTVGFVPTMGALHCGHTALVERCRAENEIALVSIFVNPTQFNDPNDLAVYPRTLDTDLALLESLGVDDVLAPTAAEFYPHGYRYRLEPADASPIMEAAHRPGFIQGVLTIVLKLLSVARARRAYFGEKDFQQLRAVTEMAEEFFVPTEIVPCPTVRAASGLAESSRNARLSPEGRTQAAALFRTLTTAESVEAAVRTLHLLGLDVDYVEEHGGRRFAAVFVEGIRLIDNVPLR